MPPALDHPCLNLIVLDHIFITYKFPADSEIPHDILSLLTKPASGQQITSLTRTAEEISLVCALEDFQALNLATTNTWRCIKIKGPMEFELTGILCDFSTPLKKAQVPIFATSTWNTDYILVPSDKIEQAVEALKADGWKFE